MKVIQLLKSIIGLVVLFNVINCSVDVKKTIMDSFKNAPKKEMFKVFHFLYEKKYELNSEEAIRKYKVFKSNLKVIEEVNSKNLSYKFGINQFTDLTPEEFKSKYLMDPLQKKTMLTDGIKNLRSEALEEGSPDYFDLNADKDEESVETPQKDELINLGAFSPLDWRRLFGPARDQGECGSCWTFSTAGVVEAAYCRKTGVKEYLSTQQMVDCDTSNNGCNGGDFNRAFNYIKNNGLMRDREYPYKALKQTCSINSTSLRKKILSFKFCSNYWSTLSLKCSSDKVYSLLKNGPLGVGIDGTVIQMYESGIFDESCSEDNHAVILAGYGVENGVEYWLVRNSWSRYWGEDGYIRVRRNESNLNSCYVTNEAYGVLV
jgi:C1A family cysteine protease